MIAVLMLSFVFLLGTLTIFEFIEHDNVEGWAKSDYTIIRLNNMVRIIERIKPDELEPYIDSVSRCHDGFTLTSEPFARGERAHPSGDLESFIAKELSLPLDMVRVTDVKFVRTDFAYEKCVGDEIRFPVDGLVVSLNVLPGRWLNAEVHPHEWHFTPTIRDWFVRSGVAFTFIGIVAVLFVRQISKPLNLLTSSARRFGAGLEVEEVEPSGPADLKRAIHAFNHMQRNVHGEITRRTNTLAAISHDIRSPLTALRVNAELLDDTTMQATLIKNIARIERLTETALEFLKGESRTEPMKLVELGALVESVCSDFDDGLDGVTFECPKRLEFLCRPEAMDRAVRNLVENAVRYGSDVRVSVSVDSKNAMIIVSDFGPGIPEDEVQDVTEPFRRLSKSREAHSGGFGLGLSIVKAVAEGHDGTLVLKPNTPTGLIATISVPLAHDRA